jgi:PAS domain S-box-containing protein
MKSDSDNFHYRKLLEALPGLFVVLTPEFIITDASDAYLAASGCRREDAIGRPFFEVFPHRASDPASSTGDCLKASLERVLSSGQAHAMHVREVKVEGGETKFWSSVNSPVLSSDGVVTHIIRRVDDVTDVIRQQREWQSIEEERDLFFSHSFDPMGIVGTDGYFRRVNPAFEKILGYTEEEICSRPLAEFLHPEDRGKTNRGIEILSSGTARRASVNRYRCKDGSYRIFSWNTTPLGDRLYSVGRDITEETFAQEQIRDLNAELAAKNEDLEKKIQDRADELHEKEKQLQRLQKLDAIGRLAGGIAHDFNNILGVILMYCDMIAIKSANAEAVKDGLKQIEKATGRGTALTRQLLIFGRKKASETENIAINSLIEDHFKMLDRLIGENIHVEFQLGEKLPLFAADPGQVEQVVMNLVINARDAMPDGGKITVETRYENLTEEFASSHLATKPGPHIVLSVTDTGCGMDEKTRSQIFEPFFTTKPVGQGTGLGLSTVYGIVKSLEGTIWVYSEVGKGTVFKIYLPASAAKLEDVVEELKPVTLTGDERLLVVEDDSGLRKLYAEVLKGYGYKVSAVENGKVAVEVLKMEPNIDLIVTDMIMPEMAGVAVVQAALAQNPDAKILCISGYPGENVDIRALGGDRIDYLQKPFNTSTLAARVRKLLDSRPLPKRAAN